MTDVKVKTADGREITLRRPPVLAQLRLVDAIGDSAANRVYLAMCLPLIYVAQIDGQDVPVPETKKQVEALFQRLDEDGLAAVSKGVEDHFKRDERAEVESAKKSPGTPDSDKS